MGEANFYYFTFLKIAEISTLSDSRGDHGGPSR